MTDAQKQIVTVGVTGASGAILAQKTLTLLEEDARVARVHLVVTEAGQRLFAEELGIASGDVKQLPSRILGHPAAKIDVVPNKDVGAAIASGSYAHIFVRQDVDQRCGRCDCVRELRGGCDGGDSVFDGASRRDCQWHQRRSRRARGITTIASTA